MKIKKIAAVFVLAAAGLLSQCGTTHAFGIHGFHSDGYGDAPKAQAKVKAKSAAKNAAVKPRKQKKPRKKMAVQKNAQQDPVTVIVKGFDALIEPLLGPPVKINAAAPKQKPTEKILTAKETGIPQGAKGKNGFKGKWYVPLQDIAPRYTDNLDDWSCIGPVIETGEASWYSVATNGGNTKTSSMEPFNEDAMTAAHRNLPNGTVVCVTVTSMGPQGKNGLGTKGAPPERTVYKFRITDSGPYAKDRKGNYRVIDLASGAVKEKMHFYRHGVAQVGVQVAQKIPNP